MQIIADALSHITFGQPVSCGKLTMFPLLNGGKEIADYLTLDDAIKQGQAIITEVSEFGSVPQLSFTNNGALPVLLVDGEELIGAKQNRILNLTILAPAHQKLNIPVSCVEQGRWSYKSAAFASAPRAQFASSRAKKVASVSRSRERGRADSDQSEVWEDIDRMAADLKVASPTSAMSDIYESYSANLDESVQKLSPVKGQIGAAFAIGGEILGFDLFDRASTLAKLLPKLVSSYAIQALSRRTDKGVEAPGEDAVRELLDAVSNSQERSFTATGEGEDVLQDSRVVQHKDVLERKVAINGLEKITIGDAFKEALSSANAPGGIVLPGDCAKEVEYQLDIANTSLRGVLVQ
jgi:hypothetical protein